jgi:hypothetical protein
VIQARAVKSDAASACLLPVLRNKFHARKLGHFLSFRCRRPHAKNWPRVIKFPRPTFTGIKDLSGNKSQLVVLVSLLVSVGEGSSSHLGVSSSDVLHAELHYCSLFRRTCTPPPPIFNRTAIYQAPLHECWVQCRLECLTSADSKSVVAITEMRTFCASCGDCSGSSIWTWSVSFIFL